MPRLFLVDQVYLLLQVEAQGPDHDAVVARGQAVDVDHLLGLLVLALHRPDLGLCLDKVRPWGREKIDSPKSPNHSQYSPETNVFYTKKSYLSAQHLEKKQAQIQLCIWVKTLDVQVPSR